MKIVVDTNIVFSALLNTTGLLADLIINSSSVFSFYTAHFLDKEIQNHWTKLRKHSKLSDKELSNAQMRLYKYISFVDEKDIPTKIWTSSEELVKDIDYNDLAFVALAKHLKAYLWTGDKLLITGLKKAGFRNVYTTSELATIRKGL